MLSVFNKIKAILPHKERNKIGIVFLLMIFEAIMEAFGIGLVPSLVASMMSDSFWKETQYISKTFGLSNFDKHTVVESLIITLILLYVFEGLFSVFIKYVVSKFVNDNRYIMQSNLVSHYLHKDYTFYMRAKSGEVIQNLTNNVDSVLQALTNLLNLFKEFVVMLAILIMLLIVNWKVTVVIVLFLGSLMILINFAVKPWLKKAGEEYVKSGIMLNQWVIQFVSAIKEIKVNQREAFFLDEYDKCGKKVARSRMLSTFLAGVPKAVMETLSVVFILVMLAISYSNNNDVTAAIPLLAALGASAVKVIPSAYNISTYRNNIDFLSKGLDSVLEFIVDEVEQNENVSYSEEINDNFLSFEKSCGLKNVWYRYPQSEGWTLKGVDIDIPRGKMIGIVGPSGAGKSTVADILLGLIKPDKGIVYSDGTDIGDCYLRWLSKVGYVPQSIYLLDGDIASNVAFGLDYHDKIDDIWKALDDACIGDFVRTLPQGLYTEVGERGIRLSGGQRQRIGIARVLFRNPELIVFDEATSALDSETEREIMESVDALHGKKTLVIIAHRTTTIKKCDYIYRVENKTISLQNGIENIKKL